DGRSAESEVAHRAASGADDSLGTGEDQLELRLLQPVRAEILRNDLRAVADAASIDVRYRRGRKKVAGDAVDDRVFIAQRRQRRAEGDGPPVLRRAHRR